MGAPVGRPFSYPPTPKKISPMKFSNLVGADVDANSTAIYVFYDLPGEPWVRVKAGGDLNRPYYVALLNSSSKQRRRMMKGKIDAAMLEENRQIDRKLYPLYLDGAEWGGWIDDDGGEEVPYSSSGFKELIEQLPSDLFDGLRSFCNEPSNYRGEDEPDEDEVEETAGN